MPRNTARLSKGRRAPATWRTGSTSCARPIDRLIADGVTAGRELLVGCLLRLRHELLDRLQLGRELRDPLAVERLPQARTVATDDKVASRPLSSIQVGPEMYTFSHRRSPGRMNRGDEFGRARRITGVHACSLPVTGKQLLKGELSRPRRRPSGGERVEIADPSLPMSL